MEKENISKPLELEWKTIFSRKDGGGPPPELVVVTSGKNKSEQPPPLPPVLTLKDDLNQMSDQIISSTISRLKSKIVSLSPKLPDNGAKLRESLKLHLEEQERRILLKSQKSADEGEKAMLPQRQHSSGPENGFKSETASSQAQPQSLFACILSKKLDEKADCSSLRTKKAFGKELYSGNGEPDTLNKLREETRALSRKSTFKCSSSDIVDRDKDMPSTGNQNLKRISSFYLYSPQDNGNLSTQCSKRTKVSEGQALNDSRSRKGETVVLVDEEDCHPTDTTEQEGNPLESMEAKFYYPSRDDPESVELCYSDIECLAPEAFLSSTIMNFYIRHLQQPVQATGKSRVDYHCFNTYFYGKLKEAVTYKRSDKDAVFAKFRRWWRGVNIFEKAYILLPIHDSLHWSLVIICIPAKEDESGPIILHLDSLGFHDSRQIFQNVRSFLKDEWSYLNQEAVQLDLPIADRIWKHLPRRIDEKIISVPQQKNDFDCGIFVLFFTKRFIKEAPERLKKRDLAMFGRQWFKPEEASGLRETIRKLLTQEFQKSKTKTESRNLSPSSSSHEDSDSDSDKWSLQPRATETEKMDLSPTASGGNFLMND